MHGWNVHGRIGGRLQKESECSDSPLRVQSSACRRLPKQRREMPSCSSRWQVLKQRTRVSWMPVLPARGRPRPRCWAPCKPLLTRWTLERPQVEQRVARMGRTDRGYSRLHTAVFYDCNANVKNRSQWGTADKEVVCAYAGQCRSEQPHHRRRRVSQHCGWGNGSPEHRAGCFWREVPSQHCPGKGEGAVSEVDHLASKNEYTDI